MLVSRLAGLLFLQDRYSEVDMLAYKVESYHQTLSTRLMRSPMVGIWYDCISRTLL